MEIKFTKALAEAVGQEGLKPFSLSLQTFQWHKTQELDLAKFNVADLQKLAKLVELHKGVYGAGTVLRDIATWIQALGGKKGAKIRKLAQLPSMACVALKDVPGHRFYKNDGGSDAWYCYYLNEVTYHVPRYSEGSPYDAQRAGEGVPQYHGARCKEPPEA